MAYGVGSKVKVNNKLSTYNKETGIVEKIMSENGRFIHFVRLDFSDRLLACYSGNLIKIN